MSNIEWYDLLLSGVFQPEFAEDLIKCYPEDGGLSHEEIRIQQESLYLAFQTHGENRSTSSEHGETSRSNPFAAQELASFGADVASQLALDEALARSLEMGDGFDDIHTFAGASGSQHQAPPVRAEISNTAGDGIVPDDMSYEELQSLGDAVGHESKGLSDDIISRLPTFKYRSWLSFWRKNSSDDECVICCEEYAFRDKLASLLCAHTFHYNCIKRWLKEKKTCPVCKMEVAADG
nr:E3 ubiquitin ligase BIG BROTHER-like [Ipomoea trifida]